MPICMTRLVAESGGSITGGAAQVGSARRHVGDAFLHQLTGAQLVRARLEDQLDRRELGTDFERIVSSPVDPVERLLERER